MKNTSRRAKSLAEAVPGDLDPTGTFQRYKKPPFWRPVAPPDPAVVSRLKREREEKETVVEVFVMGDQIRDPIINVVNDGMRRGAIMRPVRNRR